MEKDLKGVWQLNTEGLSPQEGSWLEPPGNWEEVPVPATWGEIEGMEEFRGRVLYRLEFNHRAADLEYDLVVGSVFYSYRLWLNGSFLGEEEAYYRERSYPVASCLRKGKNVLLMEVFCPPDASFLDVVPGVFFEVVGNPGGIWEALKLVKRKKISIEKAVVSTLRQKRDTAEMALTLAWETELQGKGTVDFKLATGENYSWEVDLEKRICQLYFSLKAPEKWWPWDHGSPTTGTGWLRIEALGEKDQRELEFGVRDVSLKGGKFYVNGQRVFVRGTGYVPPWPPQVWNQDIFLQDIKSLKEDGINGLAVFSWILPPSFYEACTREGILVWQTFPLLEHVQGLRRKKALYQAGIMAEKLRKHESVVLWACRQGGGSAVKKLDGRLTGELTKTIHLVDGSRPVLTGNRVFPLRKRDAVLHRFRRFVPIFPWGSGIFVRPEPGDDEQEVFLWESLRLARGKRVAGVFAGFCRSEPGLEMKNSLPGEVLKPFTMMVRPRPRWRKGNKYRGKIIIVNDTNKSFSGRVEYSLKNEGEEIYAGAQAISIAQDSLHDAGPLEWKWPEKGTKLELKLFLDLEGLEPVAKTYEIICKGNNGGGKAHGE